MAEPGDVAADADDRRVPERAKRPIAEAFGSMPDIQVSADFDALPDDLAADFELPPAH